MEIDVQVINFKDVINEAMKFSLTKKAEEIEEAVSPSYFDCIEVYEPLENFESGGTVFIITESEPQYIHSAIWAYKDPELEDIMEGKKLSNCIILVDSIDQDSNMNGNLFGIKGYCYDYGGDNYLAYPMIRAEETGEGQVEICQCCDIQEYLRNK